MPRQSAYSSHKTAPIKKDLNVPLPRVYSPPPPATSIVHPPQYTRPNTFFESMTMGLGLGVGSSLGRHAVDKVFASGNDTIKEKDFVYPLSSNNSPNNFHGSDIPKKIPIRKCLNELREYEEAYLNGDLFEDQLHIEYLKCMKNEKIEN